MPGQTLDENNFVTFAKYYLNKLTGFNWDGTQERLSALDEIIAQKSLIRGPLVDVSALKNHIPTLHYGLEEAHNNKLIYHVNNITLAQVKALQDLAVSALNPPQASSALSSPSTYFESSSSNRPQFSPSHSVY